VLKCAPGPDSSCHLARAPPPCYQADQLCQAQAALEAGQRRLEAAQDKAEGERVRLLDQQHQVAVEQQAMAALR
jgi:hypothetical protein